MVEQARSLSNHAPVAARPSASVILVRRAPVDFDVLLVQRVASSRVGPNSFVFPGGVVQASDSTPFTPGSDGDFTAAQSLTELSRRGSQPPSSEADAAGFWRAAFRELFEEAGVLLATDTSNEFLRISEAEAPRFAALQRALHAEEISLFEILKRERLTLAYRALHYFSHWITPVRSDRRFDTRFFVAEMPAGLTALHCQIETSASVWIQPQMALEHWAAGKLPLPFPTQLHLERLSNFRSVAELLAFAAEKPIRTVEPIRVTVGGIETPYLPPEVDGVW